VIAPSLVAGGIVPMAAHLFLFYFGMMSMVTPPIGFAAMAAAGIAGTDPHRTGFAAMRLGWTAYVVPFLFAFSPSLLLMSGTGAFLLSVGAASLGIWLATAAMLGTAGQPLGPARRLAHGGAGLLLMMPHDMFAGALWWNAAGLCAALLLMAERRAARLRPAREGRA